MPLERLEDDHRVTTGPGVEFWMADEVGSLVFCRVSHEALRDLAARVHFEGTDDKVFEAYRELIEQVASDTFDAGVNVDKGLHPCHQGSARSSSSQRLIYPTHPSHLYLFRIPTASIRSF